MKTNYIKGEFQRAQPSDCNRIARRVTVPSIPFPVPFGTGGVHYRTVPSHQKTLSFDGEEGPWSGCL